MPFRAPAAEDSAWTILVVVESSRRRAGMGRRGALYACEREGLGESADPKGSTTMQSWSVSNHNQQKKWSGHVNESSELKLKDFHPDPSPI